MTLLYKLYTIVILTITLSMTHGVFNLVKAQTFNMTNSEIQKVGMFGAGVSSMDFLFLDEANLFLDEANGNFPYIFDGSLYSLFLGNGRNTGITLSYGTDENINLGFTDTEARFINVSAVLGGNSNLYSDIAMLDLNLYMPIRVNFNYTNLNYDLDSEFRESITEFPIDPLNILQASFGLGLGLNYKTSRFFPFFQDTLFFDLFFTRALGANVHYNEREMYYGAARQDNITFKLTFLELLGDTSFTIGYRYRGASMQQDGYDDVFELLLDGSDKPSGYDSHMFIVGIRF